MDKLRKKLEQYVSEVTGLDAIAIPTDGGHLPYFISRQYGLYRLEISNTTLTAVFLKEEESFKPLQFVKHMQQIPSIDMETICIVAASLPTYVRKRLIERRIAFVMPGTQMYLPMLGMELRSRAWRNQPVNVKHFSPATQVVLIHWLLGRVNGPVTPLELSRHLRYSTMSMTRALDELESTQLGSVERYGKRRMITFQKDRKIVWEGALPRLRTSVTKTVRVSMREWDRKAALVAGLSALSIRSMLNESEIPEYAVSRDEWKRMQKESIEEIPIEEPGTCSLQIWRYDPKVLAVDRSVDPFSLYLSLRDQSDERVEMALEEMMRLYL
ncbi:MAG: transcriptional regulator [Lysobacterales bacterium]|nr:MAG: transcriptional regulator [Xanthomonadales bacterium]